MLLSYYQTVCNRSFLTTNYRVDGGFYEAGGYIFYLADLANETLIKDIVEMVEVGMHPKDFGSAVLELQLYNANLRSLIYYTMG